MINPRDFIKSASYIAFLLAITILLSTKGITDEGIVSLNGDMPRYIMNGVYFYDLIGDLPIIDPLEHAKRYFARYPALSLGHHPLLYAIFGVSVFSARLTVILFMLLAVIAWFLLVRSMYDETVAFFSSLLFVTTPFIVKYSRVVMSEIPALALIIVATYFFYKYCETDKKKHAYATAVSLALSVYAKHTAVFIFPVLLAYLIMRKGAKRLIKKELIVSYMIILVLILPLIPITLKFSQGNVAGVLNKTLDYRFSLSNLSYYIIILWKHHLTLPVLILSLTSIFVSVYRKDGRATIFLFWIACSYLLITYLGYQIPRYAIYWIPAFCLFAATTINIFQYPALRVLVSTMLFLIAGYQFVYAFKTEPEYAYGYEQAARYVVENKTGESVLYGGENASSYFIFFVRKHDPDRDLVVLRANKILATSKMKRIVEERITKREEIYEILNDFGVGYVVIEDTESESRTLEWLREEVKSDKFILRKKISLKSNRSYVNKVPLYIYEYKEYMSPRDDVILHMNIPLVGGSIKIPFKDLIKKN
jgi:hypothetical protein